MLTALKLPQDRGASSQNHRVAHRIMRRPNLHVRAVKRVANVDRIIEQQSRDIVLGHLMAKALEPIRTRIIEHRIRYRTDQRFVSPFLVQVSQLTIIFECGVNFVHEKVFQC